MSSGVPEGWSRQKLGDSLVPRPKSKLPSGESNPLGYYDFYVCSHKVLKSFHNEYSSPSILFSTGGEASVHLATERYAFSTDVWATEFEGEICNEYVFRLLEENIRTINYSGFQGSGIKHLDKSFIEKLKFSIPPLPEQKKIASILTSVDEVIENTQKQIDKLQDLKKATMNELLTKGIGHTEFKDCELGRIPKSWEVRRLDELLDKETKYPMRSGPFGSSLLKHELVPEGVPFLGIDNVHVEEFRGNYKRFITKEKFIELARYEVFPEDLIVTIMGTVGRCCIIPNDVRQAISSKHTWVLTFDKKLVMPHLVCWQINHSNWVLKHFADNSQGGVMDSISSETLKKTVVPVPPLEEQRAILKVYLELENLKRTLLLKLHQTQSLKKSLMQDLLTGKVRVTVN